MEITNFPTPPPPFNFTILLNQRLTSNSAYIFHSTVYSVTMLPLYFLLGQMFLDTSSYFKSVIDYELNKNSKDLGDMKRLLYNLRSHCFSRFFLKIVIVKTDHDHKR